MGLEVVFAAIANFLPGALAGYFFEKGLDRYLGTQKVLQDELQEVIQDTISEYADQDNRNYDGNLPFYHSANIIGELLKFRVMSPEDFNTDGLIRALSNEPQITPPTQAELNSFLSLFISKINSSESLKELEIKETFNQEIFTISRKITELSSNVENLVLAYTGDLQLQWKDRVDAYVKTLQAFKPATAFALLESLEKSFASSANKPGLPFMAFLEYQKGQCLGFIGRKQEAYRAKLKAWNLDKSNVLYGQSAAISLFRLKDKVELDKVLNELLQLDSYNPVYWALKMLQDAVAYSDLKEALTQVPLFVREDFTFRRVLYNESNREFHFHMHDLGMSPNCLDYQEKTVTIDNYNEAIFWVNSAIENIFGIYFLDYHNNNQDHRDQMHALNSMLKHFLAAVRGSEIADNFENLEFLYAYTLFSLSGQEADALQLEAIFVRMEHKQSLFAVQAANALQLTGLVPRAIALLESEANLTSEGLLLLLYCYQKIDNMEGYRKASRKFVLSIGEFDERFLLMFINLLVELKLLAQLEFFEPEDFLANKTFSDTQTEKLVRVVVAILFGAEDQNQIDFLREFADKTQDDRLADIVGSVFFAAGHYEQALHILGKNLDGKGEGRELFQYIHAQSKAGKDWGELLRLLENWRLNLAFNGHFLRLEAQLRQHLVDWPAVVEICEYYLKELPDDSAMLALYVQTLHRINTPETIEKIKNVPERAKKADFHRGVHVIPIAQILLLHGMGEAAFELIYPFAKDPNEIEVRAAYTGMVLGRQDHGGVLMEYAVVEPGYFLSYARGGRVYYIEMDQHAQQHAIYKQFIGKTIDEKISVPRRMSNLHDEYTIKRIMNKYLALFDEILNQSKEDPQAGLPFEMMEINPEHPGGFLGMISDMFGNRNKIEEKTKDADFDAYYQGTLSFSELISAQYGQKFIQGYYGLIRYRKGIKTLRNLVFANHRLNDQTQIVLDFTGLVLIYQIWLFHGHSFGHKFIVSKYLVDLFHTQLGNLQYDADPFGGSDVDLGKQAIGDGHFEFTHDLEKYLTGLLDWIRGNCEVTLSNNTIDMIKKADIRIGKNHVIDAAVSTLLLVTDDDNRILVSDDIFSIKMNLLSVERFMSTEHYLKLILPPDSPVFDELVSNRYINYSPTAKQLDEAYLKKLSGQYSNYDLLVENLCLINDVANVETGVQHLKDIALKPLLTQEQVIRDLTIILVSMLKASNLQVIDLVGTKLYLDFALLGTRRDDVINAFNDAKMIILSQRNT